MVEGGLLWLTGYQQVRFCSSTEVISLGRAGGVSQRPPPRLAAVPHVFQLTTRGCPEKRLSGTGDRKKSDRPRRLQAGDLAAAWLLRLPGGLARTQPSRLVATRRLPYSVASSRWRLLWQRAREARRRCPPLLTSLLLSLHFCPQCPCPGIDKAE